MRRKFLWAASAVLVVGTAAVWLARRATEPPARVRYSAAELYAARSRLGDGAPPAQSTPKALPWGERVRLAIGALGFRNADRDRELGDLIAAQLSRTKGLELVEREQLDSVLREQGLNASGLVRARAAVRAGKLLRADWLLMNQIASLYQSRGVLWIGYGRKTGDADSRSAGGLGKIDLPNGRVTSFSPPIGAVQRMDFSATRGAQPTRLSVTAIAEGMPGDVWFITDDGILHQFRAMVHTWEEAQQGCTSLTSDSSRLFLGQTWTDFGSSQGGSLGVGILDLSSGMWRNVKGASGFATGAATAVTVEGRELWVGGFGYIALLDMPNGTIRKFARVSAQAIDQIQLGGGYLWAEYDKHLHRMSLGSIQ